MITPVGTSHDVIQSIVLQSDGKIVAGGYTYNGSNAAGVYDPSRELDVKAPVLSGAMYGWNMVTREGQAAATGLYMWAVEDNDTGKRQVGKFLLVKSDREGAAQ